MPRLPFCIIGGLQGIVIIGGLQGIVIIGGLQGIVIIRLVNQTGQVLNLTMALSKPPVMVCSFLPVKHEICDPAARLEYLLISVFDGIVSLVCGQRCRSTN